MLRYDPLNNLNFQCQHNTIQQRFKCRLFDYILGLGFKGFNRYRNIFFIKFVHWTRIQSRRQSIIAKNNTIIVVFVRFPTFINQVQVLEQINTSQFIFRSSFCFCCYIILCMYIHISLTSQTEIFPKNRLLSLEKVQHLSDV